MGVMNTDWMRTFKSELRWALRVSPKDKSSRRKPFFMRGKYETILTIATKKAAMREAEDCTEQKWLGEWKVDVTPVRVRVTVEEI